MYVVVAVLLDLDQQTDLRLALGGEGFQKGAVLLRAKGREKYMKIIIIFVNVEIRITLTDV